MLRHPELIVLVRCRPTRAQLDGQVDKKEHHTSFAVEPTRPAIDAAVDNRVLTPVAVATVMLWGKRVLGEAWFEGARPRVESACQP